MEGEAERSENNDDKGQLRGKTGERPTRHFDSAPFPPPQGTRSCAAGWKSDAGIVPPRADGLQEFPRVVSAWRSRARRGRSSSLQPSYRHSRNKEAVTWMRSPSIS